MEIHEGRTRRSFESRVVGEHAELGGGAQEGFRADAAFEIELKGGRDLVGRKRFGERRKSQETSGDGTARDTKDRQQTLKGLLMNNPSLLQPISKYTTST